MALKSFILSALFITSFSSFVTAMPTQPEVKEGPHNCIWDEEKLPSAEDIERTLFAVHATDTFPEGGVVRARIDIFRPILHFSLGALVSPHIDPDTGKLHSWDEKNYAVITSLKTLAPQLVNINPYDTFILGDLKLDATTILLVPEGTDTNSLPGGIEIETYGAETSLREAVDRVIQRPGGCSVKMQATTIGSAMVGNVNINHPDYFQAFLAKYQEWQISYGSHSLSLVGDAYKFGILSSLVRRIAEKGVNQGVAKLAIDEDLSEDGIIVPTYFHLLNTFYKSVYLRPYPQASKETLLKSEGSMAEFVTRAIRSGIISAGGGPLALDANFLRDEFVQSLSEPDFIEFLSGLLSSEHVKADPDKFENIIQLKRRMEHKKRIYADRDHLLRFGLEGNDRILKRYLSNLHKKSLSIQKFELLKILYNADDGDNIIHLTSAILSNKKLLEYFRYIGVDIPVPFGLDHIMSTLVSFDAARPGEFRDVGAAMEDCMSNLKSSRDHLIHHGISSKEILDDYLASFFQQDQAEQMAEFLAIMGRYNNSAYRPELLKKLLENDVLRAYLEGKDVYFKHLLNEDEETREHRYNLELFN